MGFPHLGRLALWNMILWWDYDGHVLVQVVLFGSNVRNHETLHKLRFLCFFDLLKNTYAHWITTLFIYLLLSVCAFIWACTWHSIGMEVRGPDGTFRALPSFHCVGPMHQTQVVRLCSKCLYLLSCGDAEERIKTNSWCLGHPWLGYCFFRSFDLSCSI